MVKFDLLYVLMWSMVCAGFMSLLNASEDSMDVVMEGYESPQKLFIDTDSAYKEEDSLKTQEITQEAKENTQQLHNELPESELTSSQPQWLYSTAIVETSFIDGSFKKGLATLLHNGFYLTSSEIIYNGKIAPKRIYAKMQDDLNANIICVAILSVKALNLDSGLALLKATQFVDSFCQLRDKTYYQDRIYKRFSIDVFASDVLIAPHTDAYYPYLNSAYVFRPQSIKLDKFASYYDFIRREERTYGFEIARDSYEEFTYGRAFYDDNGVFLGIMSRVGMGYLPVLVNRNVIQDFLCDLQEQGVINDKFVHNSCIKLGTHRIRFFTDTQSMTSFY